MAILIFVITLSLLVIVHELGHFLVAKFFGMGVEEFGLGYPPRAKKLFRRNGTDFTLNWLPFGGFVKILGENPNDDVSSQPGSFASKNRFKQATVLLAGVAANILLAWLLLWVCLMVGLEASVGSRLPVSNTHLEITEVITGSPADQAGIRTGDTVVGISRTNETAENTPEATSRFIGLSSQPVTLNLKRGSQEFTKEITPVPEIIKDHLAIGIGLDSVGIVKLGPMEALFESSSGIWSLYSATVEGLSQFFKNIFVGRADFSQVAGPIGLVGLVGSAARLGLVSLLSFVAIISINLAVLNLLPIPALDGGRLLFVIIEAVRRKAIPPKVFQVVNNIGFSLLILLMLIITVRDIWHLL